MIFNSELRWSYAAFGLLESFSLFSKFRTLPIRPRMGLGNFDAGEFTRGTLYPRLFSGVERGLFVFAVPQTWANLSLTNLNNSPKFRIFLPQGLHMNSEYTEF